MGMGNTMNIEELISTYVGGRHRGPDAYPVEIASHHSMPRHRADVAAVATADHLLAAVPARHRADLPAA